MIVVSLSARVKMHSALGPGTMEIASQAGSGRLAARRSMSAQLRYASNLAHGVSTWFQHVFKFDQHVFNLKCWLIDIY